MREFEFHVPTKILFGPGAEEKTGAAAAAEGAGRVLVLYGGGSAVRGGLVDRVKLSMAQAGIGITICPELFLRATPAPAAGSVGVDLFPLTDPSTYGRLVAGYREGRELSHFGQRFVELAQELLRV